MVLIIISLSVLFVLALIGLFFQIKRVHNLEDIINILLTNQETISNFITEASEKINASSLKDAFQQDDETGVFFKELQDIQEVLDDINNQLNGKEELEQSQ